MDSIFVVDIHALISNCIMFVCLTVNVEFFGFSLKDDQVSSKCDGSDGFYLRLSSCGCI